MDLPFNQVPKNGRNSNEAKTTMDLSQLIRSSLTTLEKSPIIGTSLDRLINIRDVGRSTLTSLLTRASSLTRSSIPYNRDKLPLPRILGRSRSSNTEPYRTAVLAIMGILSHISGICSMIHAELVQKWSTPVMDLLELEQTKSTPLPRSLELEQTRSGIDIHKDKIGSLSRDFKGVTFQDFKGVKPLDIVGALSYGFKGVMSLHNKGVLPWIMSQIHLGITRSYEILVRTLEDSSGDRIRSIIQADQADSRGIPADPLVTGADGDRMTPSAVFSGADNGVTGWSPPVTNFFKSRQHPWILSCQGSINQ